MAQRAIREYTGKSILSKAWSKYFGDEFKYAFQSVLVNNAEDLRAAAKSQPWLQKNALAAKPDMLFGKRGINNLVLVKIDSPGDVKLNDVADWIEEKQQGETTLKSGTSGKLTHFLVEPFVPHNDDEEYFVCILTAPEHDLILLSAKGGINIEEHWDQVLEVKIPLGAEKDQIYSEIKSSLSSEFKDQAAFTQFTASLYQFFKDYHYSYLEINPLVIQGDQVFILDSVAKLDDTARFIRSREWGGIIEYPTPFGILEPSREEKMIQAMDEASGASMKLTLLNLQGRVWTLVAGGGASVVYADTIADLIGVEELANYGEYSGNPSVDETYTYAKTVFDLMTKEKDPQGRDKILFIGGGIANFTDVAKTFEGIIRAMRETHKKMQKVGVNIYVRRGGPNYEAGLKNISEAGEELGLNIEVYGPETHITDIIRIALDR